VNDFVQRLDVDGLVEQTDLGAVIARSSGGVASEALDSARSQAVGLDQFIDRWVQRGLRRKQPGPAAPAMVDSQAQPPALPDGRAQPPALPDGQPQS
jgi:GMP synthase PP-ATPase subunit